MQHEQHFTAAGPAFIAVDAVFVETADDPLFGSARGGAC
jgi:hypothetical protein